MCPICWISGFIAMLFGGSFIAVVNHPISWILGSIVTIIIFYGLTYKEHEKMHQLLKKHGIEKHNH
jgi:uncharacterized membrane protein AbrB (regulator of aidB expression)